MPSSVASVPRMALVPASEFGSESDDPFASLNDNDEQEGSDPFSLDEEEQDITAFGKRNNHTSFGNSSNSHTFSASRGLTSLFSTGAGKNDGFDDLDRSSSDSGSDIDSDNPPLEARTSLERRPLDIDDDDDEEMGEMVAPTEEGPNSSDEEVLSPTEKERLGNPFGGSGTPDEPVSEFDGQGDEDQEEQLVEIAMPASSKRRSRG